MSNLFFLVQTGRTKLRGPEYSVTCFLCHASSSAFVELLGDMALSVADAIDIPICDRATV